MNNLSEKMLFSYTDMIYLTKEERTMFENAPNEVWWERISQNSNATKQSKTNQEEINESVVYSESLSRTSSKESNVISASI